MDIFRYQGKFFRFNQRFRGKIKPTMIEARRQYVTEWRRTYYAQPPKGVSTRFRADFRYLKELIGNQTVYLKGSGCIYNREANTCELRFIHCIFSFDANKKINGVGTNHKGIFSSAMFDLEPIDCFPREPGGTAVPGERYVDSTGCCGRDSDVYIALGGNERVAYDGCRFKMYGTGKPYRNSYDKGYEFKDGQAVPITEQTPEQHLTNVMYGNQTVTGVYGQTGATAYASNYANVGQAPTITSNGDGTYTLTYD